jgi:type I restriction enzyme R subunit
VPIFYTGRKTEWQIDEAKLDVLFDQWFAGLDEKKLADLKRRGVEVADLLKHPKRIELIAYDIWTHFKAYARPDGFKAQVVAIDRDEHGWRLASSGPEGPNDVRADAIVNAA